VAAIQATIRRRNRFGATARSLPTWKSIWYEKGAAQLNETFRRRDAERGIATKSDLERLKFSVAIRDLDGSQVLSSTAYGVFNVNGNSVPTKTQGFMILTSNETVSLTMTYSLEVEGEMNQVWSALQHTFQVKK
jgi:hypothetical protein